MTVVIHSRSLPIICYGKVKVKHLLWAKSVFFEILSSHYSLLSEAALALKSLSKSLCSFRLSSRMVLAASASFSFLEKTPPLSLIRRLLDIRARIKSFICFDIFLSEENIETLNPNIYIKITLVSSQIFNTFQQFSKTFIGFFIQPCYTFKQKKLYILLFYIYNLQNIFFSKSI